MGRRTAEYPTPKLLTHGRLRIVQPMRIEAGPEDQWGDRAGSGDERSAVGIMLAATEGE